MEKRENGDQKKKGLKDESLKIMKGKGKKAVNETGDTCKCLIF